ncbi:hypothetical protein PMAYCL1PPCAC_16103 [Pristionchus mayeri]|uniref:Secreted protein n=1 Tax=Pristionchus mayeri TaxID=1317129 RepID=A0AAN5CK95_9BILA|nr:hypothetical protein PMAYCL1PPCAC_16103 [Pristionchus mayeri]
MDASDSLWLFLLVSFIALGDADQVPSGDASSEAEGGFLSKIPLVGGFLNQAADAVVDVLRSLPLVGGLFKQDENVDDGPDVVVSIDPVPAPALVASAGAPYPVEF